MEFIVTPRLSLKRTESDESHHEDTDQKITLNVESQRNMKPVETVVSYTIEL